MNMNSFLWIVQKLSVVSYENDEEENEDSDLFGESDKDEDELKEVTRHCSVISSIDYVSFLKYCV